ncbi:MAG: aminomethyl-transferring glycine dehydrogenase [Verrucomicrobiales bacterium]|nr:aminomethyl-transferring glycine dehydrogenase [Verrucomicrobiales bacterium]MED5585922.1 aminomethyl-transferring glycine dehydrogenase [Verrucomicrobiota bacterium]
MKLKQDALMENHTSFHRRHLGCSDAEAEGMASECGYSSVEELINSAIPGNIRLDRKLELPAPLGEMESLLRLKGIMDHNKEMRSLIGQGYYNTVTPPVIARCVFENPGWYTAYTPYQAEIAQGRLEVLLTFQSMVSDLTALPVANASLLDEATAAAEAMALCLSAKPQAGVFFVSEKCHPQTIAIVQTRAKPLGIEVIIGNHASFDPAAHEEFFGALVQYPDTEGKAHDYSDFAGCVHACGGLLVAACDPLALTLLKPPGEWGADVAIGSAGRFGVPLGNGGPHAAFIACTDKLKRKLPGRLVGISRDRSGNPAYRLSLQTREQHIRRDRATSNICTAQVLLAVIAALYSCYHGPDGLRAIATRIASQAKSLAGRLRATGLEVTEPDFDTFIVNTLPPEDPAFNLRNYEDGRSGISIDETVTNKDLSKVALAFGAEPGFEVLESYEAPENLSRTSKFLEHPVFNSYHTETEMLRYLRRLEGRDLTLNHSMIPLGSCTMKLNSATEMLPVSWPSVKDIHPFAPAEQRMGYATMLSELESWLAEITGFHAVSLQPNAGSQGEYAGLLAIRGYHQKRGEEKRDMCLVPTSAHGTNPASAVMAGFRVIPVNCDEEGNIDLEDINSKVAENGERIAALMITYPSTHGVFEEHVGEICKAIHSCGAQIYMDGANMNAQVGLCRPGDIGADVCHLNLHKTFCIPHGGGGPGVGPIAVAEHLADFLPGGVGLEYDQVGAISAAPYGSASITVISWMYIQMMGSCGLTKATQRAILNANYIANRLDKFYPVLYRGKSGLVAHECIIDLRPIRESTGIDVEDIAKRLIDYGFHAPTMSWPVAGTMMIEPTESESVDELDRFCDAMIQIHNEIESIRSGASDAENNALKNAPHTALQVTSGDWPHPYSRKEAAFPAKWVEDAKYWPPVTRIDNAHGDRNLICTCAGVEQYQDA